MNRLQTLTVGGLFCLAILTKATGAESENPSPAKIEASQTVAAAKAELIRKYDANRNGKIDINERNGYVRERAQITRATARAERDALLAAAGTSAPYSLSSNQVSRLRLLGAGLEDFERYDVNRDGRLDADEVRRLKQNVAERARKEPAPRRETAASAEAAAEEDNTPTGENR